MFRTPLISTGAIEERFYGRTGRTIIIGTNSTPDEALSQDFLAAARSEAAATDFGDMHATLRHARIPAEQAKTFFERVVALADEYTMLPRSGDTVFGFVAAVYRTDQPTLPERP